MGVQVIPPLTGNVVTVQRGSTALSNTGATVDVTITTVDVSKTFVQCIYPLSAAASLAFNVELLNSTTLRVRGESSGSPWSGTTRWEVVEIA